MLILHRYTISHFRAMSFDSVSQSVSGSLNRGDIDPVYGVGSVLTEASVAIDLKFSPDKGRHLIVSLTHLLQDNG